MTPEQAMNSVQSQIRQRNDAWKVQLTYNGSVAAEIDAKMLNFTVDPAAVMNKALMQGHEGDLEQRYEAMLRLEQEPYMDYTAMPQGDTGVIDAVLMKIKESIDRPAVDAELTGFDKTLLYPFLFSDEQEGYSLDIEPVKEKLYKMASTMESGTVELVPEVLEPSVTKGKLMKNYRLRADVSTPIDKHSDNNRNNNIRRAFEFFNGAQLNPGETFSFNNWVGPRTQENGFISRTGLGTAERIPQAERNRIRIRRKPAAIPRQLHSPDAFFLYAGIYRAGISVGRRIPAGIRRL